MPSVLYFIAFHHVLHGVELVLGAPCPLLVFTLLLHPFFVITVTTDALTLEVLSFCGGKVVVMISWIV